MGGQGLELLARACLQLYWDACSKRLVDSASCESLRLQPPILRSKVRDDRSTYGSCTVQTDPLAKQGANAIMVGVATWMLLRPLGAGKVVLCPL
eukprot:2699932-Amphidinium_carterae.1